MSFDLIFGLNRLIIGLVVFLMSYQVIKTSPNGWIAKNPVLFKWLSGFLVVSGSYSIVAAILMPEKPKQEMWTENDKKILIQNCIKATGENGKKYPEQTKVYCICSVNNITDSIQKDIYLALSKKPLKEQMEVQYKYVEDCLDELNRKIKEVKEKK